MKSMRKKNKNSLSFLKSDNNSSKILAHYKIVYSFLLVGWTAIIVFFLLWKIKELRLTHKELALSEAKILVEIDTLYNNWNTFHGGVYVAVNDSIKSNSYVKVPHKILEMKDGTKLILVNSPLMKINEFSKSKGEFISRLISLHPLNPLNKPDKLEREALLSFEKGNNEYYSLDTIDGKKYYRFIAALKLKSNCLTCHTNQNYKIGDIYGGISVSILASRYDNYYYHQLRNDITIHSLIWLSGILIIIFISIKMYSRVKDLRISQENFITFLNNSPTSTFIKDEEGNLIYMNTVAENFLPVQFRNGAWYGLKDSDIWEPEIVNKLREHDQEVLTTMQPKVFEETIVSGNQMYIWLTHKFPIKDNSNGKIYIVGIEIDITERKQKEEEIKKYTQQLEELNKSKDKFISVLAHDLRGPFTPILGYTELLANSTEYLTYQEIKEYAHSLDVIVKNQYQLLENILDWSRLENNRIKIEPKELNLFQEVNKIFNLYQPLIHDKEIKFIEKVNPSYEIITDQHSLNTIMRNLISNAIKYTPRKGVIQVVASKENDVYKIQVIDTGIGIPKENLGKLFGGERGFTTRGTNNEKGTGLGLTICKELIEKLGGNISVESEVDKGTTFTVILPNLKIDEQ